MPEFYPSTGEAVGAAMQHNIRLAHGVAASANTSEAPVSPTPRSTPRTR